jgi:hypothetical protein
MVIEKAGYRLDAHGTIPSQDNIFFSAIQQ